MSLLANSNAIESGGYNIERSLRFRSSASAYFNRTPASAGNRKTWTWSGWAKRSNLGAWGALFSSGVLGGTSSFEYITFRSDDTLQWVSYTTSTQASLITTQVFRDPSAWYHIVVAFDSTQATTSNRVKIYVNGVQVTAFSTATYPALNYSSFVNNNQIHTIGRDNSGDYLDGYLTEINFIDGQALTPSSFGEFSTETGVWVPKKYTGTYGTNGFYLDFKDNTSATTLAYDKSGNGNNWTPNNISTTAGVTYDSMLDTPTPYADGGNGRGNYCTLNPVLVGRSDGGGASWSAKDGNLYGANANGSGGWAMMGATMAILSGSGKYYFECTVGATGQSMSVGVQKLNTTFAAPYIVGYTGDSNGYSYSNDGLKWNNGSTSYGSACSAGDVVGVAVDASGGTSSITFYKNGVTMGSAFTGITGDLLPAMSSTSGSGNCAINFGQRPFSYTPPTGFKALNTQNLPTPTISNGATVMAATLWTGNGTSQSISNAVNGISFQPDMVWVKDRSAARSHVLIDAVRGTGLTLFPNETTADQSNTDRITSFNSNGFSVGAGLGTNANTETYVGWQWKESATAGFDIVTYTGTEVKGASVNHSLGVTPAMIITKGRSLGGYDWPVYHKNLTSGYSVLLNTTGAQQNTYPYFNSAAPTSTVFYLPGGTDANRYTQNKLNETYVAYLFAEIPGFSKFGSYTGNGSADGPFVYCGFRPRFVMIKRTDIAASWSIMDTSRSTINVIGDRLVANDSAAELIGNSSLYTDILSNGFKARNAYSDYNANGGTYIFAAFAENPMKYSLAR